MIKLNCRIVGKMDQIYISASAQLEKILKENAKDVSSDEKTKLTNLIKDLKAEVQKKRDRTTKFEALEKSLKRSKPALLKQIAEIIKSLDDGSMSIVGKANISVPPEQKTSEEEHAFQLLDELYKQAFAVNADLVIENTDTPTKAKITKGGKGKGNIPTKMESRQVSDKIKSVSSVLTEMGETIKQVKKLKHESDFLAGLLEALYDSIFGGEDTMSNKQSSASPGNEQSGYDKAIKILRTFQEKEREEEHTTRLLDQLYKQTTAVNDGQIKYQTEKPKKDNKTNGKGRTYVQGQKKTDAKLKHDEKFELILSALKKLDEAHKKAEHASNLLDQLYKQAAAFNGDQVQTQRDISAKVNKTKGKERNVFQDKKKSETENVLKDDEKFESVLSALKKMYEANKEAEHTSYLLDQLYKQATAVNGEQVKKQTDMSKKDNKTKTKERKDAPDKKKTEKDNVLKHDEKFESVSFVLKKMDEANNGVGQLKYELECLEEMLDELKKTVNEGGKDPIMLSASAETEDERQAYKSARQILQKFKEKQRLAEHATDLLDDLYKQTAQFIRNQVDENTKDAASPSKPVNKQNALRKTNAEAENRTPSDAYSTLDKRCKVVSSALSKLQEIKGDAQRHEEKILLLEGIWDDLLADARDLVEGKTSKTTQSALDQRSKFIDEEKESLTQSRLQHAKMIYEIQVGLKREAEYAARLLNELKSFATTDKEGPVRNILSEPPKLPSRGDKREDHEGKGTNSNQSKKLVGGNPSSGKLNQNYEIASAVVNKQIEAQYAARLLDELSNFLQTTLEGDDRKILSDPPVRTEQGTTIAETSKTVSQQIQDNKGPSTHFEKASAILNQIKEKQKLLIEKNHIEEELKNLQATIDLYVSDIKNSERKNVSLQQDTERGNKQSEERLKKLQLLSMENSELKKEIDKLRTRLSEIAGAKLTHENPAIADLSDPNRPTKLAEKYSEIYDNQWTDAFSTLSKLNDDASDEELTGHLYNILVDGYRFCASVRMRQKKSIEVIMLHPDVNVESSQGSQTEKVNEIFSKLLSDAAKISSDMTSVNMVKAFTENDEMQNKYGRMMMPCKTYIEECIKLSWLMQIQTPPVCIDLKTANKQAFPKDTYREFTSKGKHIAFVVWPALFLHDGGPLLSKGVAQGK